MAKRKVPKGEKLYEVCGVNQAVYHEMSRFDGGYHLVGWEEAPHPILIHMEFKWFKRVTFRTNHITIDRWRSFQCLPHEGMPTVIED